MRLYHGTSSKHLESILDHGIAPRGDAPSNWLAASNSQAVYLTVAYGLYFAQHARSQAAEDLVIVEISSDLLETGSLVADEDALYHAWQNGRLAVADPDFGSLSKEEQAMRLSTRIADYAPSGLDHQWSLSFMGNCAHMGTVPPTAITRILRYAPDRQWWLAFHDPVISPLNFRYMAGEMEATQLVAAGRLDEATEIAMPISVLDLRQVEELCASHREIVFDRTQAPAPIPA
jgi:hypothetical protein